MNDHSKNPKEPEDKTVQPVFVFILSQMLNKIDWLPAVPLEPMPPLEEFPGGCDPVEELERLAIAGDENAVAGLVLLHSRTSLAMDRLMRENPRLLQPALDESPVWFGWKSPMKGLLRSFTSLRVGASLFAVKSKANLTKLPNACVYKLISYMILIRIGLITNSSALKWEAACKALPPLTKDSEELWWDLAKKIIPDMFPTLHKKIYGEAAGAWMKGDATHELKKPFFALWPLFFALLKVDANHR